MQMPGWHSGLSVIPASEAVINSLKELTGKTNPVSLDWMRGPGSMNKVEELQRTKPHLHLGPPHAGTATHTHLCLHTHMPHKPTWKMEKVSRLMESFDSMKIRMCRLLKFTGKCFISSLYWMERVSLQLHMPLGNVCKWACCCCC